MSQDELRDHGNNGSYAVADDEAYLEYRQTPLNACSIETCCDNPVVMMQPNNDSNSVDNTESDTTTAYLPLCLGCYQLDESTGKRNGRLDLFAVPVKKRYSDNDDHGSVVSATIDTFGNSINLLGGADNQVETNPPSGVLDGKWYPQKQQRQTHQPFQNYFASAHASGEILIHHVEQNDDLAASRHPFRATLAGTTESNSDDDDDDTNPSLCLALAWDHTSVSNDSNESLDTRIISSYSNGHAAIHRIQQHSNENDINSTKRSQTRLETTLELHWSAHKMFTAPAEVWCCAFVPDNLSASTNIVATGGDEGSWKLWDLRTSLAKPIHHCPDDFGAGVTVIAPHPRQSHLLAIGSYDETVALYDVRYLPSSTTQQSGAPNSIFHSDSLGGGVWRCKWHPCDDDRLLVAAMHGGCRVVTFNHLGGDGGTDDSEHTSVTMGVDQKFTEHQSMAYGADWLVYTESERTSNGNHGSDWSSKVERAETAASCSFYDQAMYLWKTLQSTKETMD